MSDPLIRGAVVARGRRISVVWQQTGGGVELLPVIVPRWPWRHDVPLDLPELVASGIEMAGAVVRPRRGAAVAAAGWMQVGVLPGPVMCRVVHGLVRGESEAAIERRWEDERRQRERASDDRPVKLVG